jgi:hypothetical protein
MKNPSAVWRKHDLRTPLFFCSPCVPLRVAAVFMPLRVVGAFRQKPFRQVCHCAWASLSFRRNRSVRFPHPPIGQALRPAPVKNASGSPLSVGHASAVIEKAWWRFVRLFVCSFVRLFVCSFVRLFVCSFVSRFSVLHPMLQSARILCVVQGLSV